MQNSTDSASAPAPTESCAPKPKSVFHSKTFWGAVLTAVAAIAPTIGDSVAEYQEKGKVSPNRISNIVVVLATTGLTVVGRVSADTPLYTPKGLPGPDKPTSESNKTDC